MSARGLTRLASVLGLLLVVITVPRAAEMDSELANDEKLLKEAKVGVDGPSLVAYFKQRTMSEKDREKLAAVVRLLGDNSFAVREKASQDLILAGRSAIPFLKPALRDPDPEIARRAQHCLDAVERDTELHLTAAAARLLAARKPDGAAEVLLGYLPSAQEDIVEEALFTALGVVGLRDGKVESAVTAALTDKEPSRRAAAAFVLGKAKPEQRKEINKLLDDKNAKVRYHASAALVRAGEKSAVPALIGLLVEEPATLAWQVEDLLFRMAGESAPTVSLGSAEAASRRACKEAWQTWWKANEGKVDLTKLTSEEPLLGFTLISELDGSGQNGAGKVWECGPDGKARWEIHAMQGPIGAQVLPGGRVLIAEHNGRKVTERDREGKVLWEKTCNNSAVSCQRLTNGNTFIATYNEVLEVTREGKTVYSHPQQNAMIFHAQKLRNGNILIANGVGIVEMEAGGKQVRSINVNGMSSWGSVEPLANGNYVIAQYATSKVVEIDSSGKVVWEVSVQSPCYATRLRNGHTLVASTEGKRVVEYDRSGKEMWKQPTQGRPFYVRRY